MRCSSCGKKVAKVVAVARQRPHAGSYPRIRPQIARRRVITAARLIAFHCLQLCRPKLIANWRTLSGTPGMPRSSGLPRGIGTSDVKSPKAPEPGADAFLEIVQPQLSFEDLLENPLDTRMA
jgi:hypothetical protein